MTTKSPSKPDNTTIDETVARMSLEQQWELWYALLPVWDQRTVMRHELEWFDLFAAGTALKDLRNLISAAQGLPTDTTELE